MATKSKGSMLNRLRQAFDEFDKNGDGKICKVELRALMERAGMKPNDDSIKYMMDLMDRDKTGEICFQEFSTALISMEAKKREITVMKLRQVFRQYDKNNDGYITKDELRAVAKDSVTDKEIDDLIKKCDIDKDGRISFEEFVVGMAY